MLNWQGKFEGSKEQIRHTKCYRTPARALRIKQIKHLFLTDGHGHRDTGLFDLRERNAQGARPRHNAGDSKTDVIGAFVAKHLRRHARHDGAFDRWCAIGIDELL